MSTIRKFLRLSAVIEATGWSRTTIWRKVKAGLFPAPIPIAPSPLPGTPTKSPSGSSFALTPAVELDECFLTMQAIRCASCGLR